MMKRKRIKLTMVSDEYGSEGFKYDTYDEAYDASIRLMKKCRDLNDGIKRTLTIN